jgi:four helix bundle protein
MTKRIYDLEERLIEFVLKVDGVVEQLPNTRLANYLAGQIIRSGTSPALNYGEVQSAESQKDFIHEIHVVLKELRETRICLKIIRKKRYVDTSYVSSVLNENEELIAIFAKSSQTAKSKLNTEH